MTIENENTPSRRIDDARPSVALQWEKPAAESAQVPAYVNQWTILLTSDRYGLVHSYGHSFPHVGPEYPRVNVVDEKVAIELRDRIDQLEAQICVASPLGDKPSATGTAKDLHHAIMNIPAKRTDDEFMNTEHRMLYKNGHRDARHAAAELAITIGGAPTVQAPVQTAAEVRAAALEEAAQRVEPFALSAAIAIRALAGQQDNGGDHA